VLNWLMELNNSLIIMTNKDNSTSMWVNYQERFTITVKAASTSQKMSFQLLKALKL
jgi:hypothetical protein